MLNFFIRKCRASAWFWIWKSLRIASSQRSDYARSQYLQSQALSYKCLAYFVRIVSFKTDCTPPVESIKHPGHTLRSTDPRHLQGKCTNEKLCLGRKSKGLQRANTDIQCAEDTRTGEVRPTLAYIFLNLFTSAISSATTFLNPECE